MEAVYIHLRGKMEDSNDLFIQFSNLCLHSSQFAQFVSSRGAVLGAGPGSHHIGHTQSFLSRYGAGLNSTTR